MKVDGEVFSSEKLTRVVMFRLDLPAYMAVRSFFIRPRMELDLPVFSCETVIMGKKRMFIVDIHRTGESTGHDDSALFDRLVKIRDGYPDLLKEKTTTGGEIQSVFSRAICQVKIILDDYPSSTATGRTSVLISDIRLWNGVALGWRESFTSSP